ncbi:hypothetical protein [Paenibacillus agricola]|nr:hypothetical protein [Paenibacillus agricola]
MRLLLPEDNRERLEQLDCSDMASMKWGAAQFSENIALSYLQVENESI